MKSTEFSAEEFEAFKKQLAGVFSANFADGKSLCDYQVPLWTFRHEDVMRAWRKTPISPMGAATDHSAPDLQEEVLSIRAHKENGSVFYLLGFAEYGMLKFLLLDELIGFLRVVVGSLALAEDPNSPLKLGDRVTHVDRNDRCWFHRGTVAGFYRGCPRVLVDNPTHDSLQTYRSERLMRVTDDD